MNAFTKHALTELVNEIAPAQGFWFDQTAQQADEPVDVTGWPDEYDDCSCHCCRPPSHEDAYVEWEVEYRWDIGWQERESWEAFRGWHDAPTLEALVASTTDDLWSEWEALHKDIKFHLAVNVFTARRWERQLASEIRWYEWYLRERRAHG